MSYLCGDCGYTVADLYTLTGSCASHRERGAPPGVKPSWEVAKATGEEAEA